MVDVNDLRAEVARRQKAAQAKVARLKRQGVELSGTVYDVRRDASRVSRYNSKQLRSYLGELNSFMKRTNQFVAGSEGAPIRAGVWRNYKRQEQEYINFVQSHYEGLKDTFIPRAGKTVEGFDKKMRRTREPGKGGVPRPLEMFAPLNPYDVVSEEKLEAMRKNMINKLAPDFVPKTAQKQKFQILEAVKAFGDEKLTQMANDMTLEQVDTLFNYTDAPRDLFAGYYFQKLLAANKADETDALIHEDDKDEVKAWLSWASSLPPRK